MGLLKAVVGSAMSFLDDMWEDYIYCDALENDVLLKKGHRKTNPGTGANSNENVITEGSRIAVNAGQILLVVENGQIVDFTAEQGGYEYHSDLEPSLFCGDYGDILKKSYQAIGRRFTYGGLAPYDQRVYFVNTKEILNNKFGFGSVPYRDSEFNITILLQGYGVFSYVITDPIVFYTNICSNVNEEYKKDILNTQLKTEIQNALLPVIGELSNRGIPYDRLTLHTEEMIQILKKYLQKDWSQNRGIEIRTMVFGNLLPDDTGMEKIRQLQEARVYSGNKSMLGARVGAAQANAMESVAENPSSAVNGLMGMGLVNRVGDINVNELMRETPSVIVQQQGDWICNCGRRNTSNMNFCPNCGRKRE